LFPTRLNLGREGFELMVELVVDTALFDILLRNTHNPVYPNVAARNENRNVCAPEHCLVLSLNEFPAENSMTTAVLCR
jgi:hypothetical protein